jgi:C-terminal processing protease CtpA/Prc
MTAPLNDSHIRVVAPNNQPSRVLFYPPFRLSRVEGRVIVTAVGDQVKAEVAVGDEVGSIDGQALDRIEAYMRAHISASSEGAFYREWNRQTGGRRDTEVTLTLKLTGARKTVTVKRTLPQPFAPSPAPVSPLPAGIGYINLVALRSLNELETQFNALRGSRGLLLDLRGYTPYGNARRFLAQRLYDHSVKLEVSEIPLVQRHSWGPYSTHLVLTEYAQPVTEGLYGGPVVVLINADAQSTPESTAIDISTEHRVTFVGSPTTGTTGGTTTLALPGGWRLEFTGTRVRYPDGRRFQNIGIVPDVAVEPTVRGLTAGKDEVLERGVEVLLSKIQASQ